MSVELTDILNFGKHKGKQIADLCQSDPGYLLWLRDKRVADNNQRDYFHPDVLEVLNVAIQNDKYLRRKYQSWVLIKTDAPAGISKTPPWEDETDKDREFAYSEEWGVY